MRRFRTLAAGALGALLVASLFLVQPAVAQHEEADGLVLRQGGVDIVTLWQGVVTGEIEVHHEEFTDPIEVFFLAPDSTLFQPDEPEFSLGAVLGDPLAVGYEALAQWSFRLEGLVEGMTDITLSILHEGHADFTSPPIEVHVEEHHVEADGLVLRQGGVDIVTVWQGVVTGQLSLQPGNWTLPFDVILLDPEGSEFQPDEPEFSLGWSFGDPLVAGFEATADWAFRLEGLTTGNTGLVLSVQHEGHADYSSPAIPIVCSPTSGVGGQPLPARLAVANAPNPFNPSTTISFRLAESGATTVSVHDVAGRLVRTLVDAEDRVAGEHAVVWDGRDAAGRPVESGIYLCRVESGSSRELRKMTLLK